MKLFVTGATGFVGKAVCRAAMSRGHEILALSRQSDLRNTVQQKWVQGSLADIPWSTIKRFQPDAALHLAWLATPGVYLQSPENEALLEQTTVLFQTLADLGVGHIAGAGTCIEYGPSEEPLDEVTSPLAPVSPYARAKLKASLRLESVAGSHGLEWSWHRIFYPYGEGEHPGRFPTMLMRRASAREALALRTPGSVKDYIHVSDLANGMISVVETRATGPINLGTGTGIRILDLAHQIARCVGADPCLVTTASEPASDDFPVTVADPMRLYKLGWRPEVTLEEGLQRLWNSLQSV